MLGRAVTVMGLAMVFACGQSTDGDVGQGDRGPARDGTDGGSGGSGATASSVAGGAGGSPGPGGSSGVNFGVGGGGAGGEPIEICDGVLAETREVPLDEPRHPIAFFVMIDRTASMVEAGPGGVAKWELLVEGLGAFARSPLSTEIRLGVGAFPAAGADATACDGSDCSVPVVPIAPLPENADAIVAGLETLTPSADIDDTPTECALRGLVDACQAYVAGHDSERCIGIFVTDGRPGSCSADPDALAGIVSAGNDAGIATYAIGLQNADMAFLDTLARAGGTEAALDLTTGAATVVDTLGRLRDAERLADPRLELNLVLLRCTRALPAPPEGEANDPDLVNLRTTTDEGVVQFPRVPDESHCAQHADAWYYDGTTPDGATLVTLCPDACETAWNSGTVDAYLGCETEIAGR